MIGDTENDIIAGCNAGCKGSYVVSESKQFNYIVKGILTNENCSC